MQCSVCGEFTGGNGRCGGCGSAVALPGEGDGLPAVSKEFSLDRRGGSRGARPQEHEAWGEWEIDRRKFPRDRPPSTETPSSTPRLETAEIVERGQQGSLFGAIRKISEEVQRRAIDGDGLLEEARARRAAGDRQGAFQLFGRVLLHRPLDPTPIPELEALAKELDEREALADLYSQLLEENPAHPSLGTLTRRVESLRAIVAFSAPPIVPPRPEPTEGFDLAARLFGDAESVEEGAGIPPPETSEIGLELGEMLTSSSSIRTREREEAEIEHARPRLGFLLRRSAGFLVDAMLLGLVPFVIVAAATGSQGNGGFAEQLLRIVSAEGALLRAALLLTALFAFVYCTLCWALGGRTLGGFLAGLRAVDGESGEALSFGRAALRACAAIVGTGAFLAGPLWALVDPQGRALHDKISGTAVIAV